MSLDPSRQWLAAGITGLARARAWDAVVTVEGAGTAGDEAEFVVLEDGRFVLERSEAGFEPAPFAAALADSIRPPYRALAVRRPELWVVGALAIETVDLGRDLPGHALEVVHDAGGVRVRVDGIPSLEQLPELEARGEARSAHYVVRAERLLERVFELEVEPL